MTGLRQVAAVAAFSLVATLIVTGCARYDRFDDIPPGAMLASEGDGRLSYVAPYDGTVFVYDRTAERMVYSGKISEGQAIVVEPDRNRVTVDGTIAIEEGLGRRSTHRVYFRQDEPTVRRRVVEEEVRIREADQPERIRIERERDPERPRIRIEEEPERIEVEVERD